MDKPTRRSRGPAPEPPRSGSVAGKPGPPPRGRPGSARSRREALQAAAPRRRSPMLPRPAGLPPPTVHPRHLAWREQGSRQATSRALCVARRPLGPADVAQQVVPPSDLAPPARPLACEAPAAVPPQAPGSPPSLLARPSVRQAWTFATDDGTLPRQGPGRVPAWPRQADRPPGSPGWYDGPSFAGSVQAWEAIALQKVLVWPLLRRQPVPAAPPRPRAPPGLRPALLPR